MAFNLEFATKPQEAYTIVASCGIVASADTPGSFVMIKNARGWDIPGGRVEPGEAPEATFERELLEESGHTPVQAPKLLTLLELTDTPTLGVTVYTTTASKSSERTATEEISDCRVVGRDELIAHYFGDKAKLAKLFELAAQA